MSQSKDMRKLDLPDYKQWKSNLKTFIENELVPRILPGKDPNSIKYRTMITTERAMDVWALAFTHPSYDSRTDHNFDVLEYKGDKMLDYCLGVYMKKKYPNSTQDTLTNFKTSFGSRDPLAEISKKTKLIHHILTVELLTDTKQMSDVFESVVGAITQIGDEYISPGIGFMLAYNYITSIYNWYDDLKIETGETSLVNQVMQGYYDALGWKKFSDSKDLFEKWNKEIKTMTLYLNQKAIDTLTKRDTPPEQIESYRGRKRAILAQAQGDTKDDARDKLYRKALRNLQTVYGISPKEAKVANIELYLNDMVKNGVIDQNEAKKIFDGVVKMNIVHDIDWNKQTTINTKDGKMFILNGFQTEENQTIQLYRIIFESEEDQKLARLRLYQLYAKYGKIKSLSYNYYRRK